MLRVKNRNDIYTNIALVEAYLANQYGIEARTQMVELIRQGNNFICYNGKDSSGKEQPHFVPSKYIGYKKNSLQKHLFNRKNKLITGSETDISIDRILGKKFENADLVEQYHEYCTSLGISKEKRTKRKHQFWILEDSFENDIADYADYSALEGFTKIVVHKIRERNKRIIQFKKAAAKNNLRCEICGFSFLEKYGEIGQNFIEVHHTNPVSEMQPDEKTRLEDLILVCSNCHSIIHSRRPCLTIEEIKSVIKNR